METHTREIADLRLLVKAQNDTITNLINSVNQIKEINHQPLQPPPAPIVNHSPSIESSIIVDLQVRVKLLEDQNQELMNFCYLKLLL